MRISNGYYNSDIVKKYNEKINKKEECKKSNVSGKKDSINIEIGSQKAQEKVFIKEIASNIMCEIKTDNKEVKVSNLKETIQKGEYVIDARKIASKILSR